MDNTFSPAGVTYSSPSRRKKIPTYNEPTPPLDTPEETPYSLTRAFLKENVAAEEVEGGNLFGGGIDANFSLEKISCTKYYMVRQKETEEEIL